MSTLCSERRPKINAINPKTFVYLFSVDMIGVYGFDNFIMNLR